MNEMKKEYAKLKNDKNKVRRFLTEQDMKDTNYQQVTYKKGNIQVVLEFPDKEQDISQLKREINEILQAELQEQLKKIS